MNRLCLFDFPRLSSADSIPSQISEFFLTLEDGYKWSGPYLERDESKTTVQVNIESFKIIFSNNNILVCPFINCHYHKTPMNRCKDLARHIDRRHKYKVVERNATNGRPKGQSQVMKYRGNARKRWKERVREMLNTDPFPDCLNSVAQIMNGSSKARMIVPHIVPLAFWICYDDDSLSLETLDALAEAKEEENLEHRFDISTEDEKVILNCLAFVMAYLLSNFTFSRDSNDLLNDYALKVAIPSNNIRPSLKWINFELPGDSLGFQPKNEDN